MPAICCLHSTVSTERVVQGMKSGFMTMRSASAEVLIIVESLLVRCLHVEVTHSHLRESTLLVVSEYPSCNPGHKIFYNYSTNNRWLALVAQSVLHTEKWTNNSERNTQFAYNLAVILVPNYD